MPTLSEMREVASKRTPGQWVRFEDERGHGVLSEENSRWYGEGPICKIDYYYDNKEYMARQNMEFITLAANTYDKLLAVAEAARKNVGLMCKNANYAHEGCNQCELAKALKALES